MGRERERKRENRICIEVIQRELGARAHPGKVRSENERIAPSRRESPTADAWRHSAGCYRCSGGCPECIYIQVYVCIPRLVLSRVGLFFFRNVAGICQSFEVS